MERLTRKMPDGRYGLVEGKKLGTVRNNHAVIDRLGAYEDSGMEPEDMYAVRLLAASAEGRLLVMPRRVDDILDSLRQMAISAVYEAALKSGHGKEIFIAAKDGINRRFENFDQTRFKAEAVLKGAPDAES